MVTFRDPTGFKMNKQVWMKTSCDNEALGRVLLRKAGVKIEGSVSETLLKNFGVKLRASKLYIMPSFNDFLGGRPINETRPRKEIGSEALIGPVLRSEAVDVDNAELYLLDGTFLGTLNQIRTL
jgi:metallophosphoesterase superfamily enzyme